jgi:sulfite reductase (ferredoxin)
MIKAAKALVQIQYDDVTEEDPDEVIDEFKERYYDTELIYDPFAGSKFADYLLAAYEQAGSQFTLDSAHHLIEESQLFIEAVHSCYNRIRTEGLSEAGSPQ